MAVDGGVVLTTASTTAFTTIIRDTTSSCGITSIGVGGVDTDASPLAAVYRWQTGPSIEGAFFWAVENHDRANSASFCCDVNVRFWHKADIVIALNDVLFRM
jgi:hypothetical protein